MPKELKFSDNRQVTLRHKQIAAEDLGRYDAVFVTRQVAQRLNGVAGHVEVYPENVRTLTQSLDWVEDICHERGYKYVALIPCGHEDEGAAIPAWTSRTRLPCEIEIYFDGQFDFADLRQGGTALSDSNKTGRLF